MSENINPNGQQQPTTPTPEASGGQGEKLFTQADLDRIIGERLARARVKAEPSPEDAREADLKAREARLDCREFLTDKKYPVELLDILGASDVETFKGNVERLAGLFWGMKDTHSSGIRVNLGGPLTGSPPRGDTAISDAFKPPKI